MPLFTRRVLQRLLDENARLLTPAQTSEHVKRLNATGSRVLQTEWEVALVNAFAQVGSVRYEDPLSDGKKVDLTCTLRVDPPWAFVADIITVSDKGFHEQNRYRELQDHVITLARENGLPGGGWDIRVEGDHVGPHYRGRRMQLSLPRTPEEIAAFDAALTKYFADLRAQPTASTTLRHYQGKVKVTITHTPGGEFISGGHPSYTTAYGIANNPVYRALQDKAKKLRSVERSMPRGVIVSDGDCATLRTLHGDPNGFGLRRIVQEALGRDDEVDFVLCLPVHTRSRSLVSPFPSEIYIQPHLFILQPSVPKFIPQAAAALEAVASFLPTIHRTPQNAILHSRVEHRRRTKYANGGWAMADPEVRISARALLNLLTGNISQREFFEANNYVVAHDPRGARPMNPFRLLSKDGRLFVSARVERSPEEDDDEVVFRFGNPDPAVGPFRDPTAPSR